MQAFLLFFCLLHRTAQTRFPHGRSQLGISCSSAGTNGVFSASFDGVSAGSEDAGGCGVSVFCTGSGLVVER